MPVKLTKTVVERLTPRSVRYDAYDIEGQAFWCQSPRTERRRFHAMRQ